RERRQRPPLRLVARRPTQLRHQPPPHPRSLPRWPAPLRGPERRLRPPLVRRRSAPSRCSAATHWTRTTHFPPTACSTKPVTCTSRARASASAYPTSKNPTCCARTWRRRRGAQTSSGFGTFAPIRVLFEAPVRLGSVPHGGALVLDAASPFAVHAVTATGVARGDAAAA